jgi:predicted nucleic acid-binding protein
VILLDTNQLHRVRLGNPTLTLLSAAAHRRGHTLAITDIVLREAVRQYREEFARARKALEVAQRDLRACLMWA